MRNLIALYSPAPQSGKTEFAKIAEHEFGYVSVPFAKPLKDMLAALLLNFYLPEAVQELLYGKDKGRPMPFLNDRSPRELMQTLGTDWGRNMVSQSLWVEPWKIQVEQLLAQGKKVIVDDMRFPNEFAAVQELMGTAICIERVGAKHNGHVSEGQLSAHPFDCVMFNTRDLADWNNYCREILGYMHAN